MGVLVKTNIEKLELPVVKWNKKELLENVYEVMDLHNTYKVKYRNEYLLSCILDEIEWTDKEKEALVIKSYKDALSFVDCEIIIIPNQLKETGLEVSKKQLAKVRKLNKEINKHKISVKKDYVIELDTFENDVKDIMALIKNCEVGIDEQVKVFEIKQKEERTNEIAAMESYIAIQDYVFFDESWLLKKWTNEKLELEFIALDETIKSQINTIKMMCTSHNINSDKYVELLKSKQLEEVLERIVQASITIAEVKEEKVVEVKIDQNESQVTITRKLTGTISSLKLLKAYAEKLGIEWGE